MYKNRNSGDADYIEEGRYTVEGDCCRQSDDEFWNENQKGLNFGENDSAFSFSQFSHSTFEGSNLSRSNVGYAEPKETSKTRIPYETSTASVSSFEVEREEKVFQTKLTLCSIKAKQHTKGSETANCYEAVKNIVLGLEYNLNPFKALIDKQKLLKAAIHFNDGNAILVIILFLRDTLKKSIFQKEILMYPDAVNMYLSYLHEGREIHELENLLLLLRRPRDAAILKYEMANLIRDPKRKLSILGNLRSTYCQSGTVERFISDSILEHCMCIEDYKVLMDHRVVSEQCDENIFEAVIRRKEITDSCAVHALVFSMLHYYNVAEIANISPSTIKTRYKIPSKKYQWCALVTLAAAKSYQNIEKLFLTKKWLGGSKIQSYISYPTLLEVLHRSGAPLEVMEKFCEAIDSQPDKLSLCQQYHCNALVIEILKKKRSRMAFLEFQKTLPPDSVDYNKISAILNSTDIKWKN